MPLYCVRLHVCVHVSLTNQLYFMALLWQISNVKHWAPEIITNKPFSLHSKFSWNSLFYPSFSCNYFWNSLGYIAVSTSKLTLSMKLCTTQGISHLSLLQLVKFSDWIIISQPESHVGKSRVGKKSIIEWTMLLWECQWWYLVKH